MNRASFFETRNTLSCRGKIINLSTPVVMGILNITPDSFYDGGKYTRKYDIIKRVDEMLHQGATIIDVGAASSRPGAPLISPDKELKRLVPVLEIITKHFPEAILSVDTYNAKVAKESVSMGAAMINDISAGNLDAKMLETVSELKVPYVLMHMQGKPETMQNHPQYQDPVKEISAFFAEKLNILLQLGIHDVMLDPGFGFGKTLEDNYRILDHLEYFQMFELPVIAGFSRKSMINKVLATQPADALNGTSVLNTMALERGADILRVHDIREAVQCIKLVEKIKALHSGSNFR